MNCLLASYVIKGDRVVYAALFQNAGRPPTEGELDAAETEAVCGDSAAHPESARFGDRKNLIHAPAATSISMGGHVFFMAYQWERPFKPAKAPPAYSNDTAGKTVLGQSYRSVNGIQHRFILFTDNTYYCHTVLDHDVIARLTDEVEKKAGKKS